MTKPRKLCGHPLRGVGRKSDHCSKPLDHGGDHGSGTDADRARMERIMRSRPAAPAPAVAEIQVPDGAIGLDLEDCQSAAAVIALHSRSAADCRMLLPTRPEGSYVSYQFGRAPR